MTEANLRSDEASQLAEKTESTLESFGIKSKVMAVNFENEFTLLELSISASTRVEEIEELSKTLALAVASPTGMIEVTGPIPGKSLLGIKIPKEPDDS